MTGDTQTTDSPVGTPQVAVVDPPKGIYNADTFADALRPYALADDRNVNPIWLRKQLLTNDEYLNTVTQNILAQQEGFELLEDEDRQRALLGVKNQIRDRLSEEVYTGQTIPEALADRTAYLLKADVPENVNLQKALDVITRNPGNYKDLGITDFEGDLAIRGKALRSALMSNSELLSRVSNDIYAGFEEDMNNTNNRGVIDTNDINDMSEAFVVYDKMGSEALTHWVNMKEEEGLPALQEGDSRDSKYEEAGRYFQQKTTDGKNVSELIKEFIHGNEGQEPMQYTPLTASEEFNVDVPRNMNNWVKLFSGDQNRIEGLVEDVRFKNEDDGRPLVFGGTPIANVRGVAGYIWNKGMRAYRNLTYDWKDVQDESFVESVARSIHGDMPQAENGVAGRDYFANLRGADYYTASSEDITNAILKGRDIDNHLYANARIDILNAAIQNSMDPENAKGGYI